MAEEKKEAGAESQWSLLPADLLLTINEVLDDPIGNLRLRAVCREWRLTIPLPVPAPVISFKPPFPTFITPRRGGHFSLRCTTIYFLQPPGNQPASPWLLQLEGEGELGNFRPLNPFTEYDTLGNLPDGFPREINVLNIRVHEIVKAYSMIYSEPNCFAVRPSKVAVSGEYGKGDFCVLAIFFYKLGFIDLRNENWTQIIDDDDPNLYVDIVYSKEKKVFYALDWKGRLITIDRERKVKNLVSTNFHGSHQYLNGKVYQYLIESNGEIFLVHRLPVLRFNIYKLNEENNGWENVNANDTNSLGDKAFFLGYDCSYVVSGQNFGLEGNCIYFLANEFTMLGERDDDLRHLCPDAGIYCFNDRRSGSLAAFPHPYRIFFTSPSWLRSINSNR